MASALIVVALIATYSYLSHILGQGSNRPYRADNGKVIIFLSFFFIPTFPAIIYMERKKIKGFKTYILAGVFCPLIAFLLMAIFMTVIPFIMDLLEPKEVLKSNNFNHISPQMPYKPKTSFPTLLIYAPILGSLFTSIYWLFTVNQKNKSEIRSDIRTNTKNLKELVRNYHQAIILALILSMGTVAYTVHKNSLKNTYSENVLFYIEHERGLPLYSIAQDYERDPADRAKALELYLVAAKFGYRPAQGQVGVAYLLNSYSNINNYDSDQEFNKDVYNHYVEAYAWFSATVLDKHQHPNTRQQAESQLSSLKVSLENAGRLKEAEAKAKKYHKKYVVY